MTSNPSGIRVEQHAHQLVVAVTPRIGLDVIVAARGDVEHADIANALDEATKEVRHVRALSSVDGSERIDEVDPDGRALTVADGGTDAVRDAFEKAAVADSFDEARYWSNVALQRWLVAEEDGGDDA